MTTTGKTITQTTLPLALPRKRLSLDRLAFHRLDAVFAQARTISFDDSTRLIFFSDCHRGDRSTADGFVANESLFLKALHHYYHKGFAYVEVGDGDELWKNRRFPRVREAHAPTFDLLHRFAAQERLHLIFGNHDIAAQSQRRIEKDGLVAEEGVILKHRRSGMRIFVTHGHQADVKSDHLLRVSRWAVRHLWRRIQLLGFFRYKHAIGKGGVRRRIAERIAAWSRAREHPIICGHTHLASAAAYGDAPYFNCGNCVTPGTLTGLEIQGGEIALVRWSAHPLTPEAQRELLSPPRKLRLFQPR